MKFFKRTFRTIDRRYLVRSYLISMLYFGIMFPFFLHPDLSPIITIFITLNTLLFPFSKIVWDASKAFVLGEHATTELADELPSSTWAPTTTQVPSHGTG